MNASGTASILGVGGVGAIIGLGCARVVAYVMRVNLMFGVALTAVGYAGLLYALFCLQTHRLRLPEEAFGIGFMTLVAIGAGLGFAVGLLLFWRRKP